MPAPDPDTIEAHRQHLSAMSVDGGSLHSEAATATTANPEWFRKVSGSLIATPERRRLHNAILQQHRDAAVETGKRAIILAGPPGAGKSTVLPSVIAKTKIPADPWRVIDADYFKERLLEQALSDGSYDRFIVPTEVKALQDAGEAFYPLELASLVHEESSILAQAARRTAVAAGENVVIDTVLAGAANAQAIGEQLRRGGYEVTLVEVEVPEELSIQRTQDRWRAGYEAAVAGDGHPLGGRWVPESLPASLYSEPGSDSTCRAVARSLARGEAVVLQYEEHRVDPLTGSPKLESEYRRENTGKDLRRVTVTENSYPKSATDALRSELGRMRPRDSRPGRDEGPER